jgi:ketosteroid isomerase-like protein
VLLVVTTQRGRGKGSGIEISNQWGFLVQVRDGLITSVKGYRDVESALVAASAAQDDR